MIKHQTDRSPLPLEIEKFLFWFRLQNIRHTLQNSRHTHTYIAQYTNKLNNNKLYNTEKISNSANA